MNISEVVGQLDEFSTDLLKAEYIRLHGEAPYSHNRRWLIRRIVWRMQAGERGGFSERFVRHGLENADLRDARVCPKVEEPVMRTPVPDRDPRIPKPGTVLERKFKGRLIRIKILENGFEWDGQVFSSFSKAVKTASQSDYSPYTFFKLGKRK